MPTADLVLAELEHVYDPEVDEPVTQMGFIRDVEVTGDDVVVHMQLPQYFCAPNFTYLMVDDVRRAAEKVVGPGHVRVNLEGHFEADKINSAMSEGTSFADVFSDAVEDLDALRDRFARKQFLIRQELVCKEIERNEAFPAREVALTDLSLGEAIALAPAGKAKYLSTRHEIGLSAEGDQPFLVAADGRPVEADKLRHHRRSASVMAISFEGNGVMCRTLINERYPGSAPASSAPSFLPDIQTDLKQKQGEVA